MIAFGPVPSRRLGKSLGINNIPPKTCSYSCIYCQLGSGFPPRGERGAFYSPEQIYDEVCVKIEQAKRLDAAIDFLTFVSDGEPTLDTNLGDEIELLKPLNIKIAVISNASLLSYESVRKELVKADWVSLKMDSTKESVWRKINRPHKSLRLLEILDGVSEFARIYRGELVTETMLVEGVNDGIKNMEELAVFLERIAPARAYVSIPTRPPALKNIRRPPENIINRAYQTLKSRVGQVECLVGYEGNEFAFTGNIEEDLLSITAVHPMREDAVEEYLRKANAGWYFVQNLIDRKELIKTRYENKTFYMRTLD